MAKAIFSCASILKPISDCTLKNDQFPKIFFPLGANATTTSSRINYIACSTTNYKPCNETTTRRSGNYEPTSWGFDYIQSLDNGYKEERYATRASELRMQVKKMLDKEMEPLQQLELIDNLQRLGISYRFEDEIKQILTEIKRKQSKNDDREPKTKDLYAAALEFRLLRQHGFDVPQQIFSCFKNDKGEFRASLCDDTKGLLHLYEASFLALEGETVLDMAREFAIKNLEGKRAVDNQVDRALRELPIHWTFPWSQARWFITMYENRCEMNPLLLEFAKLDFNLVQATYQQELKQLSSWWRGTCLANKLPFARDRMVECFVWITGAIFEPQYGLVRAMLTKLGSLVTVTDDVYDVYGSLEELELFTSMVERWDVDSIHQLPDYMQLCFLAINNFVNETAYDVLKETGVVTITYLRKVFADFCKAQLKEAKWSSSEHCPTMEEYMDNAWLTIAVPIAVAYAFPFVTNPLRSEDFECVVEKYPNVIRWSGTIARLGDDLGTSTDELKRGDVSKSIQCYMNETGASEDEARKHVKFLINETWKKMNKYLTAADFPVSSQKYTKIAANFARMALYLYHSGDGVGIQSDEAKDRILELLFEPIPLNMH